MTVLLAWAWAPLALYVLLLGLGLLVDRLLSADLPGALLAPVGLAIALVVVTPLYRAGASAAVVLPVVAVAAIVGLALARNGLRERLWQPWALLAAGAVYLLHMAPVIFSGDVTWAGYNFVNDNAANFILIDVLEHDGATAPPAGSATSSAATYLVTSGYPIGSHALVATLRPLTGVPVEGVYQPVLALLAGLTAMSLTEIGRRASLRPAGAALAATLAMGGVLFYRYALQGAIKEIVLTALCAAAVALAVVALERRLPVRLVMLIALCSLGMVLAFSAAAGAYALALGGCLLLAAVLSPHRPSWRHLARLAGVAAAIGLVVLLPSLGSTLDFAQVINDVFAASGGASTGRLGQLARPLPAAEAAGVWLAHDYRLPVQPSLTEINAILVGAAVLIAVAGAGLCVAGRRIGPLLLLGTVALPAAALAPAVSPYIDAKLMVTLTPAVVLIAAIGALLLIERSSLAPRLIGASALLVLGASVLASDLFSYRAATLAPPARVDAMVDAAEHVPGKGLWLLNEWEEFGKYFMRSVRVNPASEAESPRPVVLRRDEPRFGRWFDLDLHELSYVEGFDGVIMRRSPAASRPPASFRLIYRNRFYELWRRTGGIRVRRHLPLQGLLRGTSTAPCGPVMRMAEDAAPGERLVAARPAQVASLSPLLADHPGWPRSGEAGGTLVPTVPGSFRGTVTASRGGRMRVWLNVSGGRPYTVFVDGRRVGEAGQINTPGQWLEAGVVSLASGRHRVEVRREGASPRPGDGFRGVVGPVALQAIESPELISVAPPNARRLCGRSWDWIELVG